MNQHETTKIIQSWLLNLNHNDPKLRDQAKSKLIEHAHSRLEILARTKLRGFSRVKRRHDTNDVLQEASFKLWKSLETIHPNSVREFFGLASLQIKRVLLNLCKLGNADAGFGDHYASVAGNSGSTSSEQNILDMNPSPEQEPGMALDFETLLQRFDRLSKDEVEVVDLYIIHDLPRIEVANVIGVSERHIQRLWRNAKLKLAESA